MNGRLDGVHTGQAVNLIGAESGGGQLKAVVGLANRSDWWLKHDSPPASPVMEYRFHHKANRYAAGELFDFPQFRRTASGEAEHECGENHAKHRHAGEHHHALRESGEIGVGGIRPIVHGGGRKSRNQRAGHSSVVGCVADCVVGRVVAGVADCVAASFIRFAPSIRSFSVLSMGWPPVVPIVFRLLPVVGVLLHESQGFGQGAYRGFALVRGQPAQQLAQMRVIFLHIDAADI